MILTCEHCQVRFKLDDNLIKESGSKVRCSKCQHIFIAYKPGPAEEVIPPLGIEEEVQAQPETPAQEPLTFEETAGAEAQAGEGVEAFAEESLDFDALEPGEEKEGEEFALEDLGLGEDFTLDEIEEEPAEEMAPEEEISMGDLGLEEEIAPEEVAEPTEEPASEEELEEDFALEDLDLSLEEAAPEEATPSTEAVDEEKTAAEEEKISLDEISLDDFGLEEETAPETPEEEPPEEEPEEEILMEKPGMEEGAEEELAEEESDWMVESDEDLEIEEERPSEAMPVPPLDEAEEAEEYEEAPFPPPMPEEEPLSRKRLSTPLLILIIIVLGGGGAFGAYTLLKTFNVRIPLLDFITGGPPPEEQLVKLLDEAVAGSFVDGKLGRLFVIEGKVRNGYPEPRSFIRVKGAIYGKGGTLLQERIAYCGNIVPHEKLRILEMPVIQRVLNNRFGEKKTNFRVPSGTTLPFMVVFPDPQQELGEYSVEVVDSVAE